MHHEWDTAGKKLIKQVYLQRHCKYIQGNLTMKKIGEMIENMNKEWV